MLQSFANIDQYLFRKLFKPSQGLTRANATVISMQIISPLVFGARFLGWPKQVDLKTAALMMSTARLVPPISTPQRSTCCAVSAQKSTFNDCIADDTSAVGSRAVGDPNSSPERVTDTLSLGLNGSALEAIAAPAQTGRRLTPTTFYKRTLPCPPAVAFSSEVGTNRVY